MIDGWMALGVVVEYMCILRSAISSSLEQYLILIILHNESIPPEDDSESGIWLGGSIRAASSALDLPTPPYRGSLCPTCHPRGT